MPFLEIKNLTKEIEGKRIIDDISFDVQKNDFIAIVGKSGAGKSTILSLLSGMDFVSEGQILFEGELLEDPREQLMRGNKEIRVVKQDYDLYPYHRVHDILELPIRMLDNDQIEERIQEMLVFFNLEEYEYSLPKELSGGMKQRLSIAFAMITYPKMLLLDEPFSHLDSHTSVECLVYIKKLAKKYGVTVLYVTHETEYALMFATKILVVSDGRILQEGQVEEIYNSPKELEVARLFGPATVWGDQIVRPEQVKLVEQGNKAEVIESLYLGDRYQLKLSCEKQELWAYSDKAFRKGEIVNCRIGFK